jgi:hypothetical protein
MQHEEFFAALPPLAYNMTVCLVLRTAIPAPVWRWVLPRGQADALWRILAQDLRNGHLSNRTKVLQHCLCVTVLWQARWPATQCGKICVQVLRGTWQAAG